MAKKKKKRSWYMYGGRPSDMNSMIPKANFGQTIGSVGDTNIAKNLDMVVPGLGTGVDLAFDTIGFFGDKKEYKDLQASGNEAGEYTMAINDGPNKGNLNFSSALSGAEATQQAAMNAVKPNMFKDLILPSVGSIASSAAGGGLGEKVSNKLSGMNIGDTNMQNLLSSLTGTPAPTKAAMGGAPQSDIYEAEGNEVIQHSPGAPPGTTGTMEPIGNNPMLSELKGKSHSSGGELVDASGQQVVYSTKLKSKTWGLSFADAAKKIGLKIESFEKSAADGDHITKQTAQSMIRSWTVKLQELQAEQDAARKEKFTKLLQDGSSFEELSQNFPDLTNQFMQAQSKQPAQDTMASTEQEFLYGGMPKRMYGTHKKYEYGSPENPNDPPFYEGERTDEEVPTNQATFLDYKGNNIYGEDQGIKDYINSIGMEAFANQWMSNMDPELLDFAGIQSFDDLFTDNGSKLKLLQQMYNEKNAGQPGFTPIPVDKGAGKFGEHSMSMAGWKDLNNAASNPDSPININDIDLGEIEDPLADDDGIMEEEEIIDPIVLTPGDEPIDLGDIEDPLADDDGIMEDEEEIEIYRDPNLGPQRGPRDDMAPTATGDPLQDRGYQIQPDPELEFEELDIDDDEEEEEEIVYDIDGNIIYDPTKDSPNIKEQPITLPKVKPGELTLNEYPGVKLPPNNQKEKKNPPPYMGDAPYNDIVADNAGVDLQPGPRKKEEPITLDPIAFEGFPDIEQELIKPRPKENNPFNTGAGDGFKSKNRWWERDPDKKKKKIDNEIVNNEKIINDPKTTNENKTKSFNNQKYFNNLAKYMSPLYNLMKSKEGAEIESKKVNPYDNQILQDMDQKVDIQPWLNQNMMAMKGGMDFSKDFASGNPMQMFSMYNRLNQGKMMNDSAAWKYKHDSEGKLKTARANMMYNIGERDRGEDIRVSGVNSQNRAAVDKYVSTAIEQLSAIGQLDEYTANLMENDKLRASFISAMAPDLEKYMKLNPDKSIDESVVKTVENLSAEEIQAMINQTVGEIPVNINITNVPTNNNVESNVENNNNEVNNLDDVNAANVLSGNEEFENPLDVATNNVNTINVADDATFNDVYSAEINGDLFTPVEGESNKYTYQDKTYVKIKQGNSELFIEEAEAIEKGLMVESEFGDGEDTDDITTNDNVNVDMDDVILNEPGSNEPVVEYTPVISSDEMTSLQPMSIQSTGEGAANILENGQPIEVEIDGGMLKVNGVRAEGDKIVVDGSMTQMGIEFPATRDFGEFIQDSNSPSGFKWVPNKNSWKQFQDNASSEQKAMFASFIKAVEGDVRYAEALRTQVSGGSGTMTGTQLNDTIRNKPE
tara:strand:- start:22003 stop:26001 length:3999 start_codon:yes stop_codon:yes gene_type:complete